MEEADAKIKAFVIPQMWSIQRLSAKAMNKRRKAKRILLTFVAQVMRRSLTSIKKLDEIDTLFSGCTRNLQQLMRCC